MTDKIQKLISELEIEKEKAIENKRWYKEHSADLTFLAMNECYEVAFSFCIGKLTQILNEQKMIKGIPAEIA